MTHSMLGLPLYPAGHSQVGLWAIVRQMAVGAHSSLLQGSMQVRDRRSHARLVAQSSLYWQTPTMFTVTKKASKCYLKTIKQTWKVKNESIKSEVIMLGTSSPKTFTKCMQQTNCIKTQTQPCHQYFVQKWRMTVNQEVRWKGEKIMMTNEAPESHG